MVWGGGSGLLGKVVRPHCEGHWVVSDSSPSPRTDGRCKIVWYCIIFDRDTICSYLLEGHLLKVYVSFWGVYRTYLVNDAGIPNPWPHTKDVGLVGKFSTKVLLSWPCFQAFVHDGYWGVSVYHADRLEFFTGIRTQATTTRCPPCATTTRCPPWATTTKCPPCLRWMRPNCERFPKAWQKVDVR